MHFLYSRLSLFRRLNLTVLAWLLECLVSNFESLEIHPLVLFSYFSFRGSFGGLSVEIMGLGPLPSRIKRCAMWAHLIIRQHWSTLFHVDFKGVCMTFLSFCDMVSNIWQVFTCQLQIQLSSSAVHILAV